MICTDSSSPDILTIGNSILPLFAHAACGGSLVLITHRRALRPEHVAPAPGRLQCRLGQDGANPKTRGAIEWREGQVRPHVPLALRYAMSGTGWYLPLIWLDEQFVRIRVMRRFVSISRCDIL